jgi:hypothetical protein
MGANFSTNMIKTVGVVENSTNVACKNRPPNDPTIQGIGVSFKGSRCSDIMVSNRNNVIGDCDINYIAQRLAEQTMDLTKEQASSIAFPGTFNVGMNMDERANIFKKYLEQECGSEQAVKQKITNQVFRFDGSDCDTLKFVNDGTFTAQCISKVVQDTLAKQQDIVQIVQSQSVSQPSLVQSSLPIIYEHNDFQGKAVELKPGRYNYPEITSLIGNDIISSVYVPPGWTVELFEHADFLGRIVRLDASVTGLPDFNDLTSAIIVTAPSGSLPKNRKIINAIIDDILNNSNMSAIFDKFLYLRMKNTRKRQLLLRRYLEDVRSYLKNYRNSAIEMAEKLEYGDGTKENQTEKKFIQWTNQIVDAQRKVKGAFISLNENNQKWVILALLLIFAGVAGYFIKGD